MNKINFLVATVIVAMFAVCNAFSAIPIIVNPTNNNNVGQFKQIVSDKIIAEKYSHTVISKTGNNLQGGTTDVLISKLENESLYNTLSLPKSAAGMVLIGLWKADIEHWDGIYKLKSINEISFYVADPAAMASVKAVIVNAQLQTLAEVNIASNALKQGWNDVKLSTPYSIPANANGIFIGFKFVQLVENKGTVPLAPGPHIPNYNYFIYNNATYDITQHGDVNLLVKAMGIGEVTDRKLDVCLQTLTAPSPILAGSNFQYEATLTNWGTSTITSFEVTHKIGDDAETTMNITGVNIKSGQSYTFKGPSHKGGILAGTFPLNVSITKLNGNSKDEDVSNNTINSSYSISIFTPKKRYFLEESTGTGCMWCPRGLVGLNEMTEQYPDEFIAVGVHNNQFGADPMYFSPYGDQIAAVIGDGSQPNSIMDRIIQSDPGTSSLKSTLNALKATPTASFGLADINIINFEYDVASRNVSFNAEATFATGLQGDLRFFVVVTEDKVTGTAANYAQKNAYAGGGSGKMGGFESLPNPVPANQMSYNHVARAIIGSDCLGKLGSIPANPTANTVYTSAYDYTIPGTMNPANLNFIVAIYDVTNNHIWNVVKKANITSVDIAKPTLKLPANDTKNISDVSIEFTWNAITNATKYAIEFGTDKSFAVGSYNVIPNVIGTTLTFTVELDKTYYWRVKAYNSAGGAVSAYSDVWKFTTGVVKIEPPVLASPANNAVDIDNTKPVEFTWKKVDDATKYEMEICKSNSFDSGKDVHSNISVTNFSIPIGLIANTKYYWRVKAVNASGISSDFSDVWNFTTKAESLPDVPKPTLLLPADKATNVDFIDVEFTWNGSDIATKWDLELNMDAGFGTNTITKFENITSPKYTVPELASEITYYWRVKAYTQDGYASDYSVVRSFTTKGTSIKDNSFVNIFNIAPNPVKNDAVLNFSLLQNANTTIAICDLSGNELILTSQYFESGNHSLNLALNKLNNGSYICRMLVNGKLVASTNFVITK